MVIHNTASKAVLFCCFILLQIALISSDTWLMLTTYSVTFTLGNDRLGHFEDKAIGHNLKGKKREIE